MELIAALAAVIAPVFLISGAGFVWGASAIPSIRSS